MVCQKEQKEVYEQLMNENFLVEYDDSGSIGRRYARADETGTPLAVTVDYQTLEDDTVTIRDRDTWKQVRTNTNRLPEMLRAYFHSKMDFKDLGKLIES